MFYEVWKLDVWKPGIAANFPNRCKTSLGFSQIDLQHINQKPGEDIVALGIDLREYYPSVEWDILAVPAERHEKYYPCCPEPYPGIQVDLPTLLKKRLKIAEKMYSDVVKNY